MYFDIRIYYKTGNSFGSHDANDLLDIPMSSYEIAKENKRRIKEHYKIYQERHSYCKLKDLQFPDFYIHFYDFGNFKSDIDGIKLLIDDTGKEHELLSPFWIGYFETLHDVKIEIIDDDDY
jgi:hypothetical protein